MRAPKILLEGDRRLAAFGAAAENSGAAAQVVGWREWVGLPGLALPA
jgi:hypothetical protein